MTEFIYSLPFCFSRMFLLTDTGGVVGVWREAGLAEADARVDHPLAVAVAVVLWHRARGALK